MSIAVKHHNMTFIYFIDDIPSLSPNLSVFMIIYVDSDIITQQTYIHMHKLIILQYYCNLYFHI